MYNERIKIAYDAGTRAYVRLWSKQWVYANGSNRPIYENEEEVWHALRAYQDEQRKKGEPMLLKEYRDGISVHVDDKGNRTVTRFFTFVNGISLVEQQFNASYTAKFTNFRWRPGHGPKRSPGINDLRNDTPIGNVEGTMQDLIDREKLSEEESMRRQWGGAWMAKNPDGSYVLEWQKGGTNG